ncbi:MAG TPA: hypothetical protein VG028_06900 [Terriglobia bacterium]|nr:hypothetical protein [Terriglobia bacterium]
MTLALLASIHPALILLMVFAVPTVLTSTWRPAVERSAQERGAQASWRSRHLFTIAATAPARRRWSSCWRRCTSRHRVRAWWTTRPWRGCRLGIGGDVVARLASGLDTQLGPTWPGGVELSFGQWQKLALARGFMRDQPLLLVLDEPTAALDAEIEHALFQRYAAVARGAGDSGRVTILVSHRFSTVRMADLIVVLDGARLVEVGTHDELMAKGGHYSELYSIQAAAYR